MTLDRAAAAAHAAVYAAEHELAILPYRPEDAPEARACAAISVAVTRTCQATDREWHGALLQLCRNFRRHGHAGADDARWAVTELGYSAETRIAYAAVVETVRDILERSGVDLADGGRLVRQLRAYARGLLPENLSIGS